MTELRTKQELLDTLRAAASVQQSAEEVQRQRISFILSMLRKESDVTRAKIEEVLAEQEGKLDSK